MSYKCPSGLLCSRDFNLMLASSSWTTVVGANKAITNECCHLQSHPSFHSLCAKSSSTDGKSSRKLFKEWSSFLDIAYQANGLNQHSPRISSLDLKISQETAEKKNIDVTTLGNLCVDIVLNVPALPPPSMEEKLLYMERLANSSPDEKCWEAGGNSNVAIAAARLGLHCVALGHVDHEKYGSFLHKVLEDEGVQVVRLADERGHEHGNASEETLVCWVLVDPNHRHGFCSRFDFNKDPAFCWIQEVPLHAKAIIQRSKVLFCNGFIFDELSPEVIASAIDFANKSSCSIFFDPGPRAYSLQKGTPDQRDALLKFLDLSDVLLLTDDEAEALTGLADPVLSAKELLERGRCSKWVIVKMGGKGCLMATAQGVFRAPAFKVDVMDTVGCGDSFAAAIAMGYMHKLPVGSTLALANAVGAATAMGFGAGRNVATVDDVMNILLSSELRDENGALVSRDLASLDLKKFTIDGSHPPPDHTFQKTSHEALNLLMKSMQNQANLRTTCAEVPKDTH